MYTTIRYCINYIKYVCSRMQLLFEDLPNYHFFAVFYCFFHKLSIIFLANPLVCRIFCCFGVLNSNIAVI